MYRKIFKSAKPDLDKIVAKLSQEEIDSLLNLISPVNHKLSIPSIRAFVAALKAKSTQQHLLIQEKKEETKINIKALKKIEAFTIDEITEKFSSGTFDYVGTRMKIDYFVLKQNKKHEHLLQQKV